MGSGRFQFVTYCYAQSIPAASNLDEEQQQGQGQGETLMHVLGFSGDKVTNYKSYFQIFFSPKNHYLYAFKF